MGKGPRRTRFRLRLLLSHRDWLEGFIAALDARIEAVMAPWAAAVERLETIPGVDQRAAESRIAALGTDRERFPTAGPLASWAGRGPGTTRA